MLFSKSDSINLERIANALEQIAQVLCENAGKSFLPNPEKAKEEMKIQAYSSDMELVAEDEMALERKRIIEKIKRVETEGNVPFFIEEALSAEDLDNF